MSVSTQQARKLCTQTELALVLESTPKQIKNLNAKQLTSCLNRARTLRDKWRDKSEKLVRTDKQSDQSKLDLENARTETKYQLFAETLERFQKRLDSVDKSAAAIAAKKKGPTVKAVHRAERSEVRTVLSSAKDQLNVSKNPPKKSVTKEPSVPPSSPAKPSKKKSPAATSSPSRVSTKSVKKKSPLVSESKVFTKKKPAASGSVKPDDAKARAAVKTSRLLNSGITGMRAHTAAKGKRNQGRRDSKR
jgi:hypothetical protein